MHSRQNGFRFQGQESLGAFLWSSVGHAKPTKRLKFVLTQSPALSHPQEQACVSAGLEGKRPQWYLYGGSKGTK